jgi:hypothetical protein
MLAKVTILGQKMMHYGFLVITSDTLKPTLSFCLAQKSQKQILCNGNQKG